MNNRPLSASALKHPICTLVYYLHIVYAATSASVQKMEMHQTHLVPMAITAAKLLAQYDGNTELQFDSSESTFLMWLYTVNICEKQSQSHHNRLVPWHQITKQCQNMNENSIVNVQRHMHSSRSAKTYLFVIVSCSCHANT